MKVIVEIKLREVRERKNLTIMQLAELSGVSKTHISAVENNKRMPGINVLCLLAAAMDVLPEDLYSYVRL